MKFKKINLTITNFLLIVLGIFFVFYLDDHLSHEVIEHPFFTLFVFIIICSFLIVSYILEKNFEKNKQLTQLTLELEEKIEESKDAQIKLKASEEKFKDLANMLPQSIFEMDTKGFFTYSNKFGFTASGYSEKDIKNGVHALELFIEEDRERIKENLQKTLQGIEFVNHKYTVLRKDKTTFPALIYTNIFQENDMVKGIRGIVLDISEIEEAQKEVSDARIMLQSVIDTIPMRVFWKDLNLNYLGCNLPFARDGGFEKAEDVIGKDDFQMSWKEVAEIYRKDDMVIIEEDIKMLNYEEPQTNEGEEIIWLETSKIPLRDSGGNIYGVLGIYDDITERKDHEKKVLDAWDKAETASTAKSSFLATMSHELRTPLNSILGYTQIMKKDKSLSPKHKEEVSSIEHSGRHLLTLINDILEITKIESGKININKEEISLTSFIKSLENMMKIRAKEKDIDFIIKIDTENIPPYIEIDEQHLRQVLINLLGNAFKFTQNKGQVIFEIKKIENNKIRFKVSDNGEGIDQKHLLTIFKPFERIKEASTSKEGAGLGLSISKNFVQYMESDLKVESELGKGTKFWFDIKYKQTEKTKEIRGTDLKEEKKPDILISEITSLLMPDKNTLNKIVEAAKIGDFTKINEYLNKLEQENGYNEFVRDMKIAVKDFDKEKIIEQIKPYIKK